MGDLHLGSGSVFADRFEIDRQAGSGGMGTVYRARDCDSGDWVALKLLHAGAGGLDEAERFVREAQILAEFHHPGIVSHVAHGQTSDGLRYLVMEWLDGEDLAQRLARGPLQLPDALRLMQCITEALAVAHQRGVVHRDLKPTNLFLPAGDIERIKILDFGIARRLGLSKAITRTGLVIGTPEYMAPEQARGSRRLTPAADIFSLGCIFYECLTGEPPFVAEHIAAVLVRILFEEPIPAERRLPGLPKAVSCLISRMLEKDAEQRIADAEKLRAELGALGSLRDLPLPPTLAAPRSGISSFAESEQILFSLVVASAREMEDGSESTMLSNQARHEAERRVSLLTTLRGLGVRADYLANGALIASVSQKASATDQASLAARVALLVKERWPEARVAVATGRGTAQETGAVGEVADRAAQLLSQPIESIAGSQSGKTSGVWLDALSARLLGPGFSVTSIDDRALLLGEEREVDPSRRLLGKPTACVGREAELAALEGQLASCIEESEARVVLLTAPPGGGKSRLRHEFLRRIRQRGGEQTVLYGQSDLMSAGAPYGILGEVMRRYCGLPGGASLEEQRTRLQARLALHLDPSEQQRIVEFLGELCDVPFPDEESPALRTARQDSKIMQSQLRRAFIDWLRATCASTPVLFVLDDLHWGDSLSISMLDHSLRTLAGAPLFILALARPEIHETFSHLWQGHKLQEVVLKGLSKRACERLIVQVLGKGISAEATARLVDQSAGNVLYLEELIRAVAEGKNTARPDTVLAMLQARIGRLSVGGRRALRAASVYGQTFWTGGIAALLDSRREAFDLTRWFTELIEEEIIEESLDSRLPNEKEYRFRHALMREAAYNLLTAADLATGHLLAGTFLEAAGEPDPMIVADHYKRGGDEARALLFYIRAAEQSLKANDIVGALQRVECGIACGAQATALGILYSIECGAHYQATRPDPCLVAGQKALDLLTPGNRYWCTTLRMMFTHAVGGSPEWQARFPALVFLFNSASPDRDAVGAYADALAWLVSTFVWAGQVEAAQGFLARLKEVSNDIAESDPTIERWLVFAESSILRYLQPKIWNSLNMAKRGLDIARKAGDRVTQGIFQYYYSMTLYEFGDIEQAESGLRTEFAISEKLQDEMTSIVLKLNIISIICNSADSEKLTECDTYALELIQQLANPWFSGIGHDALARVKLKQGSTEQAELEARKAYAMLGFAPVYGLVAAVTLIDVLLTQGRALEALPIAEDGLQRIARVGCAGYNEVAMRLAASEVFHAAGDPARAHAELRETLRQIQLRADDIPEPLWRESYLTRNPDNVRARKLARDWEVDPH